MRVEDTQKETQHNMSILVGIIAQNTQLSDDKNKLIFDIQEVDSKVEK